MKLDKNKFLFFFSLAASVVVLAIALTHLSIIWTGIEWFLGVMSPIILGLCIAFVLNVIMSGIEKRALFWMDTSTKKILRKLKRPLAIILTLLISFGFVALIISVVYPSIKDSVELIITKLPGFMKDLTDNLNKFIIENNINLEFIGENGIDWMKIGETIIGWVKDNTNDILNITTGVAGNIFGTIFDFILAFILALYVLAGKEKIRDFFHNLLKAVCKGKHVRAIEKVSKLTYASFAKFITGQVIEAVLLACLCAIGMLILKIPMVSVVAVIVGVTALIPIFGAWIGGALGMFFILLVDPMKALVFIIFLLILQQLEGNIIYPKVVGDSIGLPGILVLCAVTVGGAVAGIVGILFSVPITSVIYTILKEFVEKKRQERNSMVTTLIAEGGQAEAVSALLDAESSKNLFAEESTDAESSEDKKEEENNLQAENIAKEEKKETADKTSDSDEKKTHSIKFSAITSIFKKNKSEEDKSSN